MKSPSFFTLGGSFRLCGLLAFLVAIGSTIARADSKPNILFIIADDLNCNLGAYGHPIVKSPNIDRLASRGVLFENAYCNAPLCGPSRASFLCGLYPEQTRMRQNGILVRDRIPDVVTMPQHFMQNGYTTARVGKLYHYNNPSGIGTPGHDDPPSWNESHNPLGRDRDEKDKIFSLEPGNFGATLSWMASEGTDEEQTDGKVAGIAVDLLKKFKESGKPFFLGVGFFKPHTPFVAPKRYFEMYDPARITVPQLPEGYLSTIPVPAVNTIQAKKEQIDLPVETARSAIQGYYATVSFMDIQVGRILDALDELDLAKNTIVVFTSDHGYHLGEHGHYQKMTLFEDAARVPLIVSYPGKSAASARTKAIVEMIDLYRTLSDMAGLPQPPEYVEGESFKATTSDPSAPARENALTMYVGGNYGYSLRNARYRFTQWGEGGAGKIELYDHETDSGEMVNLARDPAQADLVARLTGHIQRRIEAARQAPEGLTVLPPKAEPPVKKK